MTRLVNDPIRVERSGASPAPTGFRLGRRRYAVRSVLAQWVEPRPWWRGEQAGREAGRLEGRSEGRAVVWRVEAVHGTTVGTYDLREFAGTWRLVRVAD